jgi:hypothetical protein
MGDSIRLLSRPLDALRRVWEDGVGPVDWPAAISTPSAPRGGRGERDESKRLWCWFILPRCQRSAAFVETASPSSRQGARPTIGPLPHSPYSYTVPGAACALIADHDLAPSHVGVMIAARG